MSKESVWLLREFCTVENEWTYFNNEDGFGDRASATRFSDVERNSGFRMRTHEWVQEKKKKEGSSECE